MNPRHQCAIQCSGDGRAAKQIIACWKDCIGSLPHSPSAAAAVKLTEKTLPPSGGDTLPLGVIIAIVFGAIACGVLLAITCMCCIQRKQKSNARQLRRRVIMSEK